MSKLMCHNVERCVDISYITAITKFKVFIMIFVARIVRRYIRIA